MKVLWFTNTPSLYNQGQHFYHGGGWIESLEELIRHVDRVELGISFFHQTGSAKEVRGKVTYYPLHRRTGKKFPFITWVNNWKGKTDDKGVKEQLLKVISDFKPDIIHVFGTEDVFASIQTETKVPVVIHLQGLLNPYYNTYFGINQSSLNYVLDPRYLVRNILGNSPAFHAKRMKNQAMLEKNILKKARFIMGRTRWDEAVAKIYNPRTTYFHVEEVLRPAFYGQPYVQPSDVKGGMQILSTLSSTVYKGVDVVLKAAQMLKEHVNEPFVWTVVGLPGDALLVKHFERTLGLYHKKVNVSFVGRKDPEELMTLLGKSHIFVHPSYIDNSPNSLCEAQMLGLPVIACAVGGVTSLIQHEQTGILVPSNGIYEIVYSIQSYIQDPEPFVQMGRRAREMAHARHDRNRIQKELLSVYRKIVN